MQIYRDCMPASLRALWPGALGTGHPCASPESQGPERAGLAWRHFVGGKSTSLLHMDPSLDPPELRAKLSAGAHAYMRRLQSRLTARIGMLPIVASAPRALCHGDVHLLQLMQTEWGQGMGDFDQLSWDSYLQDVIRGMVSARLLADSVTNPERAVDEFLDGYYLGLRTPGRQPPPLGWLASAAPPVHRTKNSDDPNGLLGLLRDHPIGPHHPDRARLERAFTAYARSLDRDPNDPALRIKEAGRAHGLGVGSYTDETYLVLVEGATDAVDDDILIELKAVESPKPRGLVRKAAEWIGAPVDPAWLGGATTAHGNGARSFRGRRLALRYADVGSSRSDGRAVRTAAARVGFLIARLHTRSTNRDPHLLRHFTRVRGRLPAIARHLTAEVEAAQRTYAQRAAAGGKKSMLQVRTSAS